MNQPLKVSSSPTCSGNSQSLTNEDGNELAAKLARRNMIAEGFFFCFKTLFIYQCAFFCVLKLTLIQ